MIILEGPDGSGKTTLADWLCSEFGLTYTRNSGVSSTSGPDGHGVVDWWVDLLSKHPSDTDHLVIDRSFFISEPIYQLATPGRPLIATSTEMIQGTQDLINRARLIIFCNQGWEEQRRILSDDNRLALEGVDVLALEKISWMYDVFYALYSESMFERVTYYNYLTMSRRAVRDAVKEAIRG